MNNFMKASRLKLRVQTLQGPLSVEQLWDLSLNKLSIIVKNVKKTLQKENDDELSFLDETTVVDSEQQLIFDVLKDIYLTKKKESENEKNAATTKLHNEQIDALIFKKQKTEMEDLSVEELLALKK